MVRTETFGDPRVLAYCSGVSTTGSGIQRPWPTAIYQAWSAFEGPDMESFSLPLMARSSVYCRPNLSLFGIH